MHIGGCRLCLQNCVKSFLKHPGEMIGPVCTGFDQSHVDGLAIFFCKSLECWADVLLASLWLLWCELSPFPQTVDYPSVYICWINQCHCFPFSSARLICCASPSRCSHHTCPTMSLSTSTATPRAAREFAPTHTFECAFYLLQVLSSQPLVNFRNAIAGLSQPHTR